MTSSSSDCSDLRDVLLAIIVNAVQIGYGPFSRIMVVTSGPLFSGNVVWKSGCFWVPSVYVLSSPQAEQGRGCRNPAHAEFEKSCPIPPTTSMLWSLLTANIGMWKHNVFRFGRKRWHKPAEKNSRAESAEELRYYKARYIGGPNPGKGVRERSCNRYRWIGKGGGSCKPVCAGYVKTDCHRNSFGVHTGTALHSPQITQSNPNVAMN